MFTLACRDARTRSSGGALAEHERRVTVPKVVDAEPGQASDVDDPMPRPKHVAGLERRAEPGGEDEVAVPVRRSGEEPSLRRLERVDWKTSNFRGGSEDTYRPWWDR